MLREDRCGIDGLIFGGVRGAMYPSILYPIYDNRVQNKSHS